MEGTIETRTCGAFYAGKRKQGGSLHTGGVWGAHDEETAGRAMARCRAMKGLKIAGLLRVFR